MPSISVTRLKERLYGNQIDGTSLFGHLVRDVVSPASVVVDLGCGKGKPKTDVRASGRLVIGCDIDDTVGENSFVNVRVRGDAHSLPFRDQSVDVIVADFLFEHLADPRAVAREAFRVLRRGGAVAFRTPNLFHYVALISVATPHWFHELVANRVRGLHRSQPNEIFETHYRMNTRRAVTRIFTQSGFVVDRLIMVEREPSYLMFGRLPFLLGMAYERVVNRYAHLGCLRSNIFGVFRKPLAA